MSHAGPEIRCADGVLRSSLGQWQGYLSAAAGDADEAQRRIAEIPPAWRPAAEAHLRSTAVLHWVSKILGCLLLDERRAMLRDCPADLRDDVRDQVATLYALRRSKARQP
jgi:hypothetical protein